MGCLLDMCTNKPDLRLGMVAGNLCASCVSTLRQFGIDQLAIDAVSRIANLVRSEALGKPVVLNPRKAFVVMRFTSNDENDNAWNYGIKVGVENAVSFQNAPTCEWNRARYSIKFTIGSRRAGLS